MNLSTDSTDLNIKLIESEMTIWKQKLGVIKYKYLHFFKKKSKKKISNTKIDII